MNGIAGIAQSLSATGALAGRQIEKPPEGRGAVEQKFQEFVAGTFYKQMLKALRRGQDKPAYFHGGQAEEMFRNQLDQTIAENLASEHGAAVSEPLFNAFRGRMGVNAADSPAAPAELPDATARADRTDRRN